MNGRKNPSHRKKGPGREPFPFPDEVKPRTLAAPESRVRLKANIGRNPRRIWREGEPITVIR